MSSTSGSDGSYTLTITFDVGTDLNTSLALVQNLVNSALAQLPGGVQQQGVTVRKVSPNILLVVSLYSEDDRFDEIFLSNYAVINLQNPLARLPGVGQVRVFGAGPYSMRVWLDPERLQTFGLTTTDVLTAIQGPERPGCRRAARRSAGAQKISPSSSRSTLSAGCPMRASSKTSSSRPQPARPRRSCACAISPGWN